MASNQSRPTFTNASSPPHPRIGRFLLTALLALFAAAGTLAGQATGNISGYVKDASGAAVPKVAVTALMDEQKTLRSAQTDDQGFYNFVGLLPGHYDLSFEANGFDKQLHTGVQLTVGQDARLDANLNIGSIRTQVQVGAAPPW